VYDSLYNILMMKATRDEVKRLRDGSYNACDDVVAAVCEVAMDRYGSAYELRDGMSAADRARLDAICGDGHGSYDRAKAEKAADVWCEQAVAQQRAAHDPDQNPGDAS
jgi:hypothetical protein